MHFPSKSLSARMSWALMHFDHCSFSQSSTSCMHTVSMPNGGKDICICGKHWMLLFQYILDVHVSVNQTSKGTLSTCQCIACLPAISSWIQPHFGYMLPIALHLEQHVDRSRARSSPLRLQFSLLLLDCCRPHCGRAHERRFDGPCRTRATCNQLSTSTQIRLNLQVATLFAIHRIALAFSYA